MKLEERGRSPPESACDTGEHPFQGPVLPYPMVNECCRGVQHSEDDQRVSKRLVDSFDRSGELSILNPRGGDLSEPEDRQRLATCKLQDDTDDRCRSEEHVKRQLCQFPEGFYPAAERRGFRGRRRIDDTPKKADNEQVDDNQASGYVNNKTDMARRPTRKVVAKGA